MREPLPTLCYVDSGPRATRHRHTKRRSVHVQLLMGFLETLPPAGAAPVWRSLDDAQRAEVVAALSRLIAKAIAAPAAQPTPDAEDRGDE
jgi:hypothetical protein